MFVAAEIVRQTANYYALLNTQKECAPIMIMTMCVWIIFTEIPKSIFIETFGLDESEGPVVLFHS